MRWRHRSLPRLSQNTLKSMPSLVAIVPFEEQRVQHFWSTAVADPFARLLLSIGSNVSPHAKGYVQRQRRMAADVQRCLRLSFHRTLRFGWLARTRYDALLFTGAKSRLGKVQCEPPKVGNSFRRHAGPAVRRWRSIAQSVEFGASCCNPTNVSRTKRIQMGGVKERGTPS